MGLFADGEPDTSSTLCSFNTKSVASGQGDIGAAVSTDEGFTWNSIGTVLDEPWHLSYPFVFQHEGQVFIQPTLSNMKSPPHSQGMGAYHRHVKLLWYHGFPIRPLSGSGVIV